MSLPFNRSSAATSVVCGIVLSLASGTRGLAQGPVAVTLEPQNGACNQSLLGQVTLSGVAPAGGVSVQLSSSAPSVIPAPAPVTVAAGATSAALRLPCLPPTQSQGVTITASAAGRSASATVTLLAPVLASLSLKPNRTRIDSVAAVTTSFSAAVRLLGPAPQGGVIVTLLNSDATVIAIPATLTVPAGADVASFDVRLVRAVSRSTGFTITATGLGVSKMVADTVRPPAPMRLEVASGTRQSRFIATGTLASGRTAEARITLTQKAPQDGLSVALTSDNSRLPVPATVRVEPDSSVAYVVLVIPVVSTSERVTLTATSGGVSVTRMLTISAAEIVGVGVNPRRVVGGDPVTGSMSLGTGARGAAVEVRLTSSDPGTASVPPRVSIPDGAANVTFPVTTTGGTRDVTVTITAETGASRGTTTLIVAPTTVTAIAVREGSVRGGSKVTFVLTAPERHPGFSASLSSDSAQLIDLPTAVRFAANESRKQLTVATAPVIAPVAVQLSARRGPENGFVVGRSTGKGEAPTSSAASATVTLAPPVVTAITLSRTGIEGGAGEVLQGTVTLDGAAPAGFGRFVGLRSTVPAIVLTGVQFAPGASTGVFELRANAVSTDQNGVVEAFLQTDPRRVTVPVRVVRRR